MNSPGQRRVRQQAQITGLVEGLVGRAAVLYNNSFSVSIGEAGVAVCLAGCSLYRLARTGFDLSGPARCARFHLRDSGVH